MKKIFALFTAICIITTVSAQNSETVVTTPVSTLSTDPATIPVIEMLTVTENEFDFGKIPQGKPVTHVFEIANKSATDSLTIANVQASCGCTTPEWDRNTPLPPNGKSKITVGYNAASEGGFYKLITITYKGTQSKTITIKGEVWKTPAASAPENKTLNDLNN